MIKREDLLFGLEIEMEYSTKVRNDRRLRKGDYHEPNKLGRTRYWRVESDGSLHTRKMDDTAEVTSIPITIEQLPDALKEFKNFFSTKKNFPLSQVMNFNDSCGAHIHVSINDKRIRNMVIKYSETRLREIALNRLTALAQENRLTLKQVEQFKKHYYRDYARDLSSESTRFGGRGRYGSVNFQGTPNTLEWRSFNLLPVTTWEEFELFYSVGIESLIEFINSLDEVNIWNETQRAPQKQAIRIELGDSGIQFSIDEIL